MQNFLEDVMKNRFSPRISLVLPFLLVCLLMDSGPVGCHSTTGRNTPTEGRTQEAFLNQEFRVTVGQEIEIREEQLTVGFTSLLNDSRCPADVTCVWEGDAEILIQVRQANAEMAEFKLHTNQRFTQAGKYRRYVIQLVALNPYPRTDREKQPSDHIATLRVQKEGNAD